MSNRHEPRDLRDLIVVSSGSDEYAIPYLDALVGAGLRRDALRLVTPERCGGDEIQELSARAAGLVLCGGLDVDPARYGEEVLPDADVELFPERDAIEWGLLDAAREAHVPVWGVCRGLQVLNVFLGGSLWQDLPTQHPTGVDHSVVDPKDAIAHSVRVLEPGAGLGDVLARETPRVNSRHHQAIKRLADGLVVIAESPDGLVEAVELAASDWWVRAVQWHPENLTAQAQQRALWQDFARASHRET